MKIYFILIFTLLKSFPQAPTIVNNNMSMSALVQTMDLQWIADKPYSEPNLTQWGLEMPYGVIELGEYWFR